MVDLLSMDVALLVLHALKVQSLQLWRKSNPLSNMFQNALTFYNHKNSDLSLPSTLQNTYSPSHDVKWQQKSSSP